MSEPSDSQRTLLTGMALAVAGTLLLSLKGIVIKLVYQYGVDAASLLLMRLALVAPVYIGIALLLNRGETARPIGWRDGAAIAGCGLLGAYAASLLDFLGLELITASLGRLVLYIYPTLVLVLSRVLFGRRIRPGELVALGVAYAGLVLVLGADVQLNDTTQTLKGAALVLASALAFALFLLGSGRLIPRYGSMRFTALAMSSAFAGIVVHSLVSPPATDLLALPPGAYALGGFLAVFCTLIPSFLMSAGIGRIGPERAAMIGLLGPASTVSLGAVVLGEVITWQHIAGGTLIMVGVLGIKLYTALRTRWLARRDATCERAAAAGAGSGEGPLDEG